MSANIDEFEPGKRIRNFEVLRILNRGGQAMIYLARLWKYTPDPWPEVIERLQQQGETPELIEHYKLCVIKVANPEWTENLRDEWNYFTRARVQEKHPKLIQTFTERFGDVVSTQRPGQVDFSFVEVPDQKEGTLRLPYIVLAYEPGGSLSYELDKRKGQPLPPPCAVQIILQVADVLSYLHEKVKVVHHDISPSNILFHQPFSLVRPGVPEVVLTDLAAADSLENPRLRAIYGKKMYLPPERLPGGPHGDVIPIDPQIDIYGLGMVMYELLVGRLPVVRTSEIQNPATSLPPLREKNPAVSAELNDLVMQAVDRNPKHRRQNLPTMRHMLARLEQLPEARQPCWMCGKWNPTRIRNVATRAGVVVVVLLLLLVGGLVLVPDDENGEPPPQPPPTQFNTVTPMLPTPIPEATQTPTQDPTSTLASGSTSAPTPIPPDSEP